MSASLKQVGMAALIGFLGQGPRAASAQTATPEETILLVGVTRGQRSDMRLMRTLEEHLRHTGAALAPSAHLTAAERLCGDGECLEQLAKREHAVLALTANVRDSGPQSYFLTLALVDAHPGDPEYGPAVNRLKRALEVLLRGFGLRCVRAEVHPEPPAGKLSDVFLEPADGI